MAYVLRKLKYSQTDIAIDRALKWFLILPQALLREPRRGGKKGQNKGEVNSRFDCLS